MKTNLKYLAAGLFALSTVFVSCKKDTVTPNNMNTTVEAHNSISQGVWKVMKFNEDGVDETNHFDGYLFEFRANRELVAIKMGETYMGTWTVSGSAGENDKLTINFGNQEPLTELNKDWKILSKVNNTINLEHVSGGNGTADYLTFERE